MFFLTLWAQIPPRGALLSAALFTLIPARYDCLMAPTSQPAYLFFIIWSVAFSLLLINNPRKDLFWLSGGFWLLTILVRGETIVIFLSFMAISYMLMKKDHRERLPWADLLFTVTIIAVPLLMSTWQHVVSGDRLPSGSQFGINNFIHNIAYYGTGFISGKAHPVLLSFFTLAGAFITYKKDRRLFLLITSWLALLSGMYFSMWLQSYGENKDFQSKMWVLIFFYPPMLIFTAQSVLGLTEKYFPAKQSAALIVLFCVLALSFIPHYSQFLNRSPEDQALAIAMRNVAMTVGCYEDAHMTDPLKANILLSDPARRQRLFSSAQKIYLVESSDDDPASVCGQALSIVKAKGQAVAIKTVTQHNTKYTIYLLSFF
ncbi:MAG: hypothetical protein HGA80_07665 [Candidatus Omnitrophica bacterium]|nr:hypothetical protein [Candidatus Omnitrophota bacterium]